MTKITHYTNKNCIPAIVGSGWLELEGHNVEQGAKINFENCIGGYGQNLHEHWRELKKQYKVAGRYVWFSEENDVRCISAIQKFNKSPLTFHSEDIGAEKWIDVAERLMSKSNRAKKTIRILNNTAKACGDDVNKWWVTKERVDLRHCLEWKEYNVAKLILGFTKQNDNYVYQKENR